MERREIAAESSGVATQILWRTPLVRIVRWRCCAERATGMLRNAWFIVSFTHTGSFMVSTRGQSEMIDSTRAMLIRPADDYQMTRCSASVASGSAIMVSPEVVGRLGGIDDPITRVSVPVTAFLLQHLLLCRAAAGGDPDLESAALWVARKTMLAPAAQAAPAVHNKARTAIDDAQGLLAARFTQQVRLEEIAQDVNRSPYHLCRAFKRGTGLPMHHYLNRLRVRASLENVMHERTNLSSLALTLGYSSHSHFSEAFRHEFRLTPTEVRRIATLPRLVDVCSALGPLMN